MHEPTVRATWSIELRHDVAVAVGLSRGWTARARCQQNVFGGDRVGQRSSR